MEVGTSNAYIVALMWSDVTDVRRSTGKKIGRDNSFIVARFGRHNSYAMPVARKGFTHAI